MMNMFSILIMVGTSQVFKYLRSYEIINFMHVQLNICELYINKNKRI
jgi:hypothetical protein